MQGQVELSMFLVSLVYILKPSVEKNHFCYSTLFWEAGTLMNLEIPELQNQKK